MTPAVVVGAVRLPSAFHLRQSGVAVTVDRDEVHEGSTGS